MPADALACGATAATAFTNVFFIFFNFNLHVYTFVRNMERDRRIELLALAWKAKVLPLYEPRILYCNALTTNFHLI